MESKNQEAYESVVPKPEPQQEPAAHGNIDGNGPSNLDRLGRRTLILLLTALVIEIAAIGFIAFLWYGDISNSVWHDIVVNEWVTRAVTLTSLALRIAVVSQGGLCLAMLAAIALEKVAVPIGSIVDISLMRAGNKTDSSVLLSLVWPMIRAGGNAGWLTYRGFVLSLVLLILSTTTLFQFASTVLVGDLSLQVIPSGNTTSNVTFDYLFTNAVPDPNVRPGSQDNGGNFLWSSASGENPKYKYGYTYPLTTGFSYWQVKAPVTWPTFAEYSETPYMADYVKDTGVSLRAFLPFASAQDRQTIRNYTGKALVLDSRVTCQRPVVTDATWNFKGWNYVDGQTGNNSYFGTLAGRLKPSKKTPRLNTKNGWEGLVSFECAVNLFNTSIEVAWSICQMAPTFGPTRETLSSGIKPLSNGLDSMFQDRNNQNFTQPGTAFLVIVPTSQGAAGVPVDTNGSTYTAVKPESTVKGTRREEFAMTVCYASLDAADRFIQAYSDRNRTEPSAQFDKNTNTLNMTRIIHQMDTGNLMGGGGGQTPTPEDRGILHLKVRNDWTESSPGQLDIDGPDQLVHVDAGRGFLGLDGGTSSSSPTFTEPVNAGSWQLSITSANLVHYLVRSLWIGGGLINFGTGEIWDAAPYLFTAVMTSNYTLSSMEINFGRYTPWNNTEPGTTAGLTVNTQDWVKILWKNLRSEPALAMQSLITSVAGMAYYDRIAQYTKNDTSNQVFFITALSPGGPFGAKRKGIATGFLAVIILLIIHVVLVVLIVVVFILQSNTSRIGDGWQALAHIAVSDELKPFILSASKPGVDKRQFRGLFEDEGRKNVHVIQELKGDAVTFERITRTV